MGAALILGALMGIYLLKVVGRRKILIVGHLLIAIIHACVAMFDILNSDIGVLVSLLLFQVVFQTTSGPVAWLYAAETTVDAALGLCLLTLWGVTLILSIICPIMMATVGEVPMFFIFSGLSLFGMLYAMYFIRESMGLTDKEKKLLLAPKEL